MNSAVAEPVAAAIGLLDLGLAGADHHVELLVEQLARPAPARPRVVGRVAVGHHVDVGLDVGEHAADDMALALHPLGADDRARLRRRPRGVRSVLLLS